MSSERATSASSARTTAARSGSARSGLAGLMDVLDRADGPGASGPRRRVTAHRPAGFRSGSIRTVPLRSVRPAPMARPAPAPAEPPHDVPTAAAATAAAAGVGLLRGLARRAALWGAGRRGEYLAWHAGPTRPLVPERPAPAVDVDPPVVLRALPSTPTIRPAAPSPVAALVPRGPAVPVAARVIPTVPPVDGGAASLPTPPARTGTRHPTGWPRPSAWPPSRPEATLTRSSSAPRAVPPPPAGRSAAAGAARARGDPSTCPVRGSPPPRWAPFAPG
jgi:hypothetical protein